MFPDGGFFCQGRSVINVSVLAEAYGDEYGSTVEEEGISEPVGITAGPVLIGKLNLPVKTTNMLDT